MESGQKADFKTEDSDSLRGSLSYLEKKIRKRVHAGSGQTTPQDLFSIAKFAYGWCGENGVIFEPGFVSEFELSNVLNKHDIYKLTGSLTLIVTIYSIHNTYKFIPLVICRQNCEIVAYYTYFECGHFEKRNRLSHQLKKLIPGVRILTFENLSKYWPLYDLVFAFEDARIINEALQSSQSEQIEQKLASNTPTLEQINQKLAEYVKALIAAYRSTLNPELGSLEGLLSTIENVCANVVASVISANSNVNEKCIGGWTPLLLAVRSGRMDLVKNLINRGADVNYMSDFCFNDHVDIVNVIIDESAEINAEHVIVGMDEYDPAYHLSVDIIKALAGFEQECITSLTLAICHGYVDIANYLIKLDADSNENVKCDPLNHKLNFPYDEFYHEVNLVYMAIIGHHTDVITALLNRKKINNGGKYNIFLRNSLMLAVWNGDLEVANVLIDRGADIDDHKNLLELAFEFGSARAVRLLSSLGAHVNGDDLKLLMTAVRGGFAEMLCFLIDLGATFEKMSSLLSYGAPMDGIDVLEILLDEGVDIDIINESRTDSALRIYVECGNEDLVKTLISRGANLNLLVEDGRIPLNLVNNAAPYFIDNLERQTLLLSLIANSNAKLRAADLHTVECSSRLLKCINSSIDGLNMDVEYNESLKAYRIEIEKLTRENNSLYMFLKETNTNELLNLWEEVADKFNVYSNNEYWDIENQYPQYADILINKANEVRKKVFVHNHKQLIDALSAHYKRDIRKMDLIVMKKFIKNRAYEIVANFAEMELPLTHFMNFGVTKKTVPRLDMIAFAQCISNDLVA